MEKIEYQPGQIVEIPHGAVYWGIEPFDYTWSDCVEALITQVINEVVDLPGHLQRHSGSIKRTVVCTVNSRNMVRCFTFYTT